MPMHLLKQWRNRSLKVRKKIIQIRNLFEKFFSAKLLQRTCRTELWHPFEKLLFKVRKIRSHIPTICCTVCSFRHLECKFHNLQQALFQTTHFFEKNYSRMWYRTCKLQFWWQGQKTFAQNAKLFKSNSDKHKSSAQSLKQFQKCSSRYVQCSSWNTCETVHPKLGKKLYK